MHTLLFERSLIVFEAYSEVSLYVLLIDSLVLLMASALTFLALSIVHILRKSPFELMTWIPRMMSKRTIAIQMHLLFCLLAAFFATWAFF